MENEQPGRYVTKNIVQTSDGKYHWVYELSMLRNPTVLITLFKVLGLTLIILFLILTVADIAAGRGADMFIFSLKMTGIMIAIFIPLALISYLIYAAFLGGKYVVLFEMDENGIVHTHTPRQYKKMAVLGLIGAIAGLASGNRVLMTNSYLAIMNNATHTVWSRVKKVKSVRKRNVIYVNHLLTHNQIYAENEDYDFVFNYIATHVSNKAKVQPDNGSSSAVREEQRRPVVGFISLAVFTVYAVVITGFIVRGNILNSPLQGARVKNQVLWETDGLTVSSKGLHDDGSDWKSSYYLTLKAENTGTEAITLTCDAAAINGIMVESDLSMIVPAGESAEGELWLPDQEVFEYTALHPFSSISFILSTDDAASGVITLDTGIEPEGDSISIGEDDPQYQGEGVVLNYVTLHSMYSNTETALKFYVENNTDELLSLQSSDVTVSSVPEDSRIDQGNILPHTCGYVFLVLDRELLDDQGLIPLHDVMGKLKFYDSSTGALLITAPVSVADP